MQQRKRYAQSEQRQTIQDDLMLYAPPCRNCMRTCKEPKSSNILWCGNQRFRQLTAYTAKPCKLIYESALKDPNIEIS